MFVKLAVLACSFAASLAVYNGPLAGGVPAHQFPAGVDPQACPNFPNCANPAVAVNQVPVSQYQPQPQYQPQQQYQPQPQYQPHPQYNPQYQPQQQYAPQQARAQYAPDVQNALDRGEYIGDGDYRGEGLAEALAPGYQGQAQSYNAPPSYNQGGYAPQPQAHQLPAGVGQPAQIPAGVDARSCPNYPFCS